MENISVTPLEQREREVNLWRAIRRHSMAATLVAAGVFAAVAYQTFEQTPTYQSNSLILVSNQTAVPVVRSEEASSSEEKVDLSTDIEILRSPTLLARALKKLAVPYNSLSVQQVALNLSINQNQDANVLNVSYTDTDPNRAKVVLEALVSTYLDYGRESQRSPVTNAVRFIEKQLPEAQATLNQSSSALTTFRKNYDLDNPDADAASAFKDKQALQQQTAEAEVSLNQTKQLYQVLQRQMAQAGQTTKTAVIDSVLSQDPTYQNLVSQLKALEVQYILESTRFHQNFPTVEELKERRDEMALLVQEHIERVIGGQKSQAANKILVSGAIQQNLTTQLLQAEINLEVQAGQLNDLRKLEARAATNFQRIVKLQQEYQELQRQNQFASQAVNDFLAKLQELQIREAQEISSWKILEPPYLPTEPTSPPLERGLLLGIVAGILAGVGVAFLLEQADHRLKGLQEIKASIDLPLLGAIPRADLRASTFRRSGVELSYRSDPFTEAIRSLALTLLFQKSSQQSARWGRTLAVTSSIAGEGKTTITYNLGLALAELGRRVLIVDADFNQPFLHKVFGLPNQTGLSTAIATEIPWQELVQAGSPNCRGDISSSQGRHNASQESLGESLNGSSPIFARVLVSPVLDQASPDRTLKPTQPLIFQHPDIMTSGPLPPNSVAWLASEKMIQLLEQWRQAYDYVLVDTPPVAALADAQSLTPKVDGVILVANLEYSTRSLLTRTVEILRRVQSNETGLVVNGLTQQEIGAHRQPHDYFSVLTQGVNSLASNLKRRYFRRT